MQREYYRELPAMRMVVRFDEFYVLLLGRFFLRFIQPALLAKSAASNCYAMEESDLEVERAALDIVAVIAQSIA
jgi:hypothetical protein